MEKHIRLLDCTLRDGGHVIAGKFGTNVIKNTIQHLVDSNVDIIEVGFLWDHDCGTDTSRYLSIADVKRILPENMGKSKLALMAFNIDIKYLEQLEPYDGTIEYIRLAFKRWNLEWGLKTAKILMDKGYKVFINPVNNNVYSDEEYIEVLRKVNELHPYAFSIVDTFGVMRISDLSHRYYLVENNLDSDIVIAAHLHENLGLAFSLAQHLTRIANPRRRIVIDGSLLGMGREPGNLCIEQMMDYMNEQFGADYNVAAAFDAIDDDIAPIKEKHPWGYAIPYALSAKYKLHRTYAEHLMAKERLRTKDIQRILSQVELSKAETFDEEYIDSLYHEYMNVAYDDSKDIASLKAALDGCSEVMIIAPGRSILYAEEELKKSIGQNTCVISVNFYYAQGQTHSNFVFLTNMKRYAAVKNDIDSQCNLIITSNLMRDITNQNFIISYNELTHFCDDYCDDSTMLLLHLLQKIGITHIKIAGFDGAKDGALSFYDHAMDNNRVKMTNGSNVRKLLHEGLKDLDISFLTESNYQ